MQAQVDSTFCTPVTSGGAGFATANVAPPSCTTTPVSGVTATASGAAAGSWISGDLSASAGAIEGSSSSALLIVDGVASGDAMGVITLPAGVTSALVTFGVSGNGAGTSGTVNNIGGTSAISTLDELSIDMVDETVGSSGASIACLTLNTSNPACPNGGVGSGFGPGSLPLITLTVFSGNVLKLSVSASVTSTVDPNNGGGNTNGEITVDPLVLELPVGATFDSGITNFLSGPNRTPGSVPEPGSVLLVATGLLGLYVLRIYLGGYAVKM